MKIALNYFLPLLLAVLCFALAGTFPNDPKVHDGLLGAAIFLMGVAVPQISNWARRNNDAGHATPTGVFLFAFAGLTIFMGVLLTTPACHQTKPDAYFEAVVDCAKINPERTSAAPAVATCLGAALAGNAVACIVQLPTVAHWTIDEATCVIADIAQKENMKVGTAEATQRNLELRNEAVGFLTRNRIRIANSYAGAP